MDLKRRSIMNGKMTSVLAVVFSLCSFSALAAAQSTNDDKVNFDDRYKSILKNVVTCIIAAKNYPRVFEASPALVDPQMMQKINDVESKNEKFLGLALGAANENGFLDQAGKLAQRFQDEITAEYSDTSTIEKRRALIVFAGKALSKECEK